MEATFNAWQVRSYGSPDVLAPVTRPIPSPGANEVLIRVRASAVSRADSLMRAGRPRFARLFLGLRRPRAELAGTCFSGEVIAVGEKVTTFCAGDEVFGEAGMQFGANATHIRLDQAGSLMRKPKGLSHEDAATLCDGALTSWHFLTRIANLRQGQNLLVLGGSGSLGSAAIQFAKALGATVTASSSAANAGLLRTLGADQVVDYNAQGPLDCTGVYDVVFDTLGIASFGAAKPALKPEGRYICPVLGLGLLRDMVLTGGAGGKKAHFAASGMSKPALHREELSEILELMTNNQFSPLMDRSYPLSDLIAAHHYVETGRKRGNVVVIS